jgi:hypothetical protein
MNKRELGKQGAAYKAAVEAREAKDKALEARRASEERANEAVASIPDEHIARAGSLVTDHVWESLHRLHFLTPSDDMPALVSTQERPLKKSSLRDISATTIKVGNVPIDVTYVSANHGGGFAPSYTVISQGLSVGESPSLGWHDEADGIDLGALDSDAVGDHFHGRREGLVAAVGLTRNVRMVEKAVNLKPLAMPPDQEAWLGQLIPLK